MSSVLHLNCRSYESALSLSVVADNSSDPTDVIREPYAQSRTSKHIRSGMSHVDGELL
jgi:hypothetical protein